MAATLKSITSKTATLSVPLDDDDPDGEVVTLTYKPKAFSRSYEREFNDLVGRQDDQMVGAEITVRTFLLMVTSWDAKWDAADPGPIPLTGIATLLATGWFIRNKRPGWAFAMTGVTIATSVITIFMTLFPRVMVSSTNPAYSLTIQNASSTPYTLSVMTVVAVIFVPIVLGYQAWTYYTFRKRVTRQSVQPQS